MARFPLPEPEEMSEQDLDDAIAGLPEIYRESRHVDADHTKTGSTHRALENNPELHELHNQTFLTLWQEQLTGLEPKETELVILTTAREFGPFSGVNMWDSHVENATMAGWTEDEIRAIAAGDTDALSDKHGALMRYAAAVANRSVTNELHDQVAQYYDPGTIAGAMVLGGYYALCNHVISAVGGEPTDAGEGYEHLSFESLVGPSGTT